jgi:hypothetical protein
MQQMSKQLLNVTKEAHHSAIEITLHRVVIGTMTSQTLPSITFYIFLVRFFLSGSVYACTHTFVIKLGPMSGMSAHLLTALGPDELGKAPHWHFPQAI